MAKILVSEITKKIFLILSALSKEIKRIKNILRTFKPENFEKKQEHPEVEPKLTASCERSICQT